MAHLKPVANYFTKEEAREYVFYQDDSSFPTSTCDPESGWYSRLSASGYLDCTDWTGPFESGEEAIMYIQDLYEVDENGDELETINT